MTIQIERDPRWERLLTRDWYCSHCTLPHRGLPDLASWKPDFWRGPDAQRPNSELGSAENILTEDFCVIEGKYFFIRCILPIPLKFDASADFSLGVWSSLSVQNFATYLETFDSGHSEELGPWFGWFSNRIKGYPETLSLKCRVHPRSDRQRPTIELENTSHRLAIDQREGITLDRLLQLFETNGMHLKAALSD